MNPLRLVRRERAALEQLGLSLPPRAEGLSVEMLAMRLELASLNWAALGPLCAFKAAAYRRRILLRSADFEVALLCWLPGQEVKLHGHGASIGAARVLLGSLRETRKVMRDGKLEWASVRTFKSGEVMREVPGEFHRVENASDGPSISLHIYAPPLTRPLRSRLSVEWRRARRLLPGMAEPQLDPA